LPFRIWQLHILASYFTDEQLDNALSSTCTTFSAPLTPAPRSTLPVPHSTSSNCSAKSKSSAARSATPTQRLGLRLNSMNKYHLRTFIRVYQNSGNKGSAKLEKLLVRPPLSYVGARHDRVQLHNPNTGRVPNTARNQTNVRIHQWRNRSKTHASREHSGYRGKLCAVINQGYREIAYAFPEHAVRRRVSCSRCDCISVEQNSQEPSGRGI